ncbi:hypothetical protein KCH_15760 [Kitasatospora cheerisanensis KCTC 2395]|uniref:Uncharacterized protein n=1 Tax=Kitasatospora cheerisanensis KCTC 2395 TaxID=1348663 RepID=A0A066Z8M0_9ACTN|nr:hypothetical protein KCH_15760 [Kitasatospora cheerisanensis KCTC 2395]
MARPTARPASGDVTVVMVEPPRYGVHRVRPHESGPSID